MMISSVYTWPDNLRRGCREKKNRPAPHKKVVTATSRAFLWPRKNESRKLRQQRNLAVAGLGQNRSERRFCFALFSLCEHISPVDVQPAPTGFFEDGVVRDAGKIAGGESYETVPLISVEACFSACFAAVLLSVELSEGFRV